MLDLKVGSDFFFSFSFPKIPYGLVGFTLNVIFCLAGSTCKSGKSGLFMLNEFSLLFLFTFFDLCPYLFSLPKLAFSHISLSPDQQLGRVFSCLPPFIISYFPRLPSYPRMFMSFLCPLSVPAVEELGFVCFFEVPSGPRPCLEFAGIWVFTKRGCRLAATFASLIYDVIMICRNLFCSKHIGNDIVPLLSLCMDINLITMPRCNEQKKIRRLQTE